MLTMITFEIATIFFFMREMFQKETQIKDHQVWNGTIFFVMFFGTNEDGPTSL
jgi:hypothetical protein